MRQLGRHPHRRAVVMSLAAGLTSAVLPSHAMAQAPGSEWVRERPLKLLVAFTAGSSTDAMARAISTELGLILNIPVVVENKGGAGGTLAAATVAAGPSDGRTILIQSAAHTVNPSIFPHLPYDTARDLSGVAALGWLPCVLVTAPSKGLTSVRQLVEWSKAHPGTTNYASAGVGSSTHLNAAMFASVTGVDTVHVPARGTSEALVETMAGRVDWFFAPVSVALPRIADGSLRALAVGTGVRSPALPHVPSMVDAEYPAAVFSGWAGAFVSVKTPRNRVEFLHESIANAMAMPAVKERLVALGASPMDMDTAQFDKFIVQDIQTNQNLIRMANVKANG